MFNKVLIANRGEIAVRIIRALRELNISSVAVYSEADRDSLHVKLADEAYCIGPANAAQSYLNIPSIMSVAEVSGADAIHPGYGFLSENPYFAEVCESSGIKFIGPKSEIIDLMGNKAKAREKMIKVGVPVIPGTEKDLNDIDKAFKLAEEIGYPVIIKAAAGGGGKGMRIVQNSLNLKNSIQAAQSEAKAAFGNSDVYLEKYVEKSKHIEFQILADEYGKMIYLGERDCSIQRRHQKIIEESPSPGLSPELRKKMGEFAIKAAKAVNYTSTGTIEFLLDQDGNFYFMEMNTRIQVEHTVTEMITGIDLVKEQIKIAAGAKLEYDQEDIKINGVALECRINAEDPNKGFIPSAGKIENYIVPGGFGVRLDSGVYLGYEVTPFYDSIIAKLIVWANNREEARLRMKRALNEFFVDGIKTTIPFHIRILNNVFFRKGEYYTNFIQKRIMIDE